MSKKKKPSGSTGNAEEKTKQKDPVEQPDLPETETATDAPEKQREEQAQETPTEQPAAETETVPKEQFDEMNDRYLRMAAEYDNFRKRSQREREQVYADAVSFAVKALLPTYDNLERALQAETEDAEYKKGVELTMAQLTESLKSLNVTVIEAAPGTPFDPNVHNAVMHAEDDSLGSNVIAEVFQQGFQIGEKVIRHSMVKVAN